MSLRLFVLPRTLSSVYTLSHVFCTSGCEVLLTNTRSYLYGSAVFERGTEYRNQNVINGTLNANGLRLHHLFPFHSKMRASMHSTCLLLSVEEFNDDCLDEKS